MGHNLHAAIIAEYEALVEPYAGRGQTEAANLGLAHLITKYGANPVRDAIASLVARYDLKGL
jgi:hypothetical protein